MIPSMIDRLTRLFTTSLIIGLLCLPAPAAAQPDNTGVRQTSGTSQLVTGAACFIVTPVYGAFKLAFAGLGAITGGLTWIFTGGDKRAAQKVWDASLKGTYIITPDHLAGRKKVYFVGPTGSP